MSESKNYRTGDRVRVSSGSYAAWEGHVRRLSKAGNLELTISYNGGSRHIVWLHPDRCKLIERIVDIVEADHA